MGTMVEKDSAGIPGISGSPNSSAVFSPISPSSASGVRALPTEPARATITGRSESICAVAQSARVSTFSGVVSEAAIPVSLATKVLAAKTKSDSCSWSSLAISFSGTSPLAMATASCLAISQLTGPGDCMMRNISLRSSWEKSNPAPKGSSGKGTGSLIF